MLLKILKPLIIILLIIFIAGCKNNTNIIDEKTDYNLQLNTDIPIYENTTLVNEFKIEKDTVTDYGERSVNIYIYSTDDSIDDVFSFYIENINAGDEVNGYNQTPGEEKPNYIIWITQNNKEAAFLNIGYNEEHENTEILITIFEYK